MIESGLSSELELERIALQAYRLERAAGQVRYKFVNDLRKIAKKSRTLYTFKDRLKDSKGIYDKIIRYRAKEPSYDASNVHDAWGCRFVTLFQEDIVETVGDILSFAKLRKNRSDDITLTSVTIYDNRPEKDPLSITPKIKEAVAKRAESEPKYFIQAQSRETGYSSVHLVFETTVELSLPGETAGSMTAYFEVQVRDIFEEGWGEISHLLSYSDKDVPLDELEQNSDGWRNHLNALKTVADGCSQHANLLRPNARHLRAALSEARAFSVSDVRADRDAMLEIIPPEHGVLRSKISQAYEILAEAFQATEDELDRSVAQPFYAAAAKLLRDARHIAGGLGELRVSLTLGKQDSMLAVNRSVRYFLDFERANSIIFALPPKGVLFSETQWLEFGEAINLYYELISLYHDDPFLHLRLGQAVIKGAVNTLELQHGIELMRLAEKLGRNQPGLPKDHWIFLDIASHIGRAYYRLRRERMTAKKYLEAAVQETERGLPDNLLAVINSEDDGQKIRLYHRLITNALFFRCMLPQEDETNLSAEGFSDAAKEKIKLYLAILTDLPLSAYSDKYIESIDNVMIGAFVVGDIALALDKAHENIGYLLTIAKKHSGARFYQGLSFELGNALDEDQKQMLKRAYGILSKIWTNPVEVQNRPSLARRFRKFLQDLS
jgi:ppGpp synthetase/RelA/SpoT-type nucleotidyltranferase